MVVHVTVSYPPGLEEKARRVATVFRDPRITVELREDPGLDEILVTADGITAPLHRLDWLTAIIHRMLLAGW